MRRFYGELYNEKPVIRGYENSFAERQAKQYEMTFEKIAYVGGDLSGDGILNINDAVLFSRYISESNYLSYSSYSSYQVYLDAGDLDGDGILTIADLSKLLAALLRQTE